MTVESPVSEMYRHDGHVRNYITVKTKDVNEMLQPETDKRPRLLWCKRNAASETDTRLLESAQWTSS